jgi:eukaryotic-like serine/threonine-protein kinase
VRLTPGIRLGPYEVLSAIGAGGMAEAYQARDTRLGRDIALKVVNEALAGDAELVRRFEQEARVAGSLNHPNLVAVYDVGLHEGVPYFITEFLQGESLRHRLSRGRIPLYSALDWAAQMAHGLAAAHARGIVHRDVKPDNVFIGSDGHVKLLDFGIAKLAEAAADGGPHGLMDVTVTPTGGATRTGSVLGTPGYMAPEQVRGEPVDARTDIFGLGAVLYEMLCGHRAFSGTTVIESGYAILHNDPEPLPSEVPPAAGQVVHRCLEKEPGHRFQSASDLAFALEVLRAPTPQGTRPLRPVGPSRRATLSAAVATALVLMVAVSAVTYSAGKRASSAPRPRVEQVTFQQGSVLAARFSPEGRVVLSAAWDGHPEELFARAPGSPDTQALGLQDAHLFAVSRTGEIALSPHPRVTVRYQGTGTLARVSGAGGLPRPVLENVEYADWTPSGDLVAVRLVGGKRRVERPLGTVVYESAGWITHLRVSPDGERLAFVHHPILPDDMGEVVLVDARRQARALTGRFPRTDGLAWSPDGREIWFTAGEVKRNGLWAVTLDGKVREIYRSLGDIRLEDIGPDGALLLALEDPRQDISFVTAGTPGQRSLNWYDWGSLAELSDDGQLIALTAASPVPNNRDRQDELTLIRRTDGSPAQTLGEGYALAFTPDGKSVLAASIAGSGLVLLPVGPGSPRQIPTPGLEVQRARWFSDGKRLVATARPPNSEDFHLYVLDTQSGSSRLLTDAGVVPFALELSPDGRYVAAQGTDDGVPIVIGIDGGVPLRFPEASSDHDIIPTGWSGAGDLWVRTLRGPPARLVRYELPSWRPVETREVGPIDPTGTMQIVRMRITPDGKSIAFDYRRMRSYLFVVRGL